MANAMLDARHEGDSYQGDSYRRIEVITGARRRRHWMAEEKARIVAESFEEGANISEMARRNGVARGLLRRDDTSSRRDAQRVGRPPRAR
jgi:transposase